MPDTFATRPSPPSPPSPPLLSLVNVTRRFPVGDGEVVVLKNLNLTIGRGELVAIMGQSGSGKSTLMNILGCLDRPSSGSYLIAGDSIAALKPDELARLRREHFGFIFQRYHLLPDLSAEDNVQIPAIYGGVSKAARRERAGALLARLGLAERCGYRPAKLSGGQQQRVSIARALMNGGEVILADEPTGALDSSSGQEVMAILLGLHALGHTVIIVTHAAAIAAHAARVIEMCDGTIVADRSTAHLDGVPPGPATWAGRSISPRPAPQINRPVGQTKDPSINPPIDQTLGPPTDQRAGRLMAPSADALAFAQAARSGRGSLHPFSLGSLGEALKIAWIAMITHRMRTLLTMLGIIIGIAAVVTVVALGEGARQAVVANIQAIGTNTIGVYPGKDWGDEQASTIHTLSAGDLAALQGQFYVDGVTPSVGSTQTLRRGSVKVSASVQGVGAQYFRVRGVTMAAGIGFDAAAVRRRAQVVTIDDNTRKRLFKDWEDPLGKTVLVGALPCRVIGVTAKRTGLLGSSSELQVFLPYTTAADRLTGQSWFSSITVRIRGGVPAEIAEQSMRKLLSTHHKTQDFFTSSSDSIVRTVEKTTATLTLLIMSVAVISLLVGGIGVMNIMLVSVTERTHEIGIRMAVGARQSDILRQFLIEAVLVCLGGGMLGIVLSFVISGFFSLFVHVIALRISMLSMALACTCCTMIGVIFGFWPARNAARLDPIDALARE